MPLTGADARRWLRGFDAAEDADRRTKRAEGPRPEWSIRIALSLLQAARLASPHGSLIDARRAAEDETVGQVWGRLRSQLLH